MAKKIKLEKLSLNSFHINLSGRKDGLSRNGENGESDNPLDPDPEGTDPQPQQSEPRWACELMEMQLRISWDPDDCWSLYEGYCDTDPTVCFTLLAQYCDNSPDGGFGPMPVPEDPDIVYRPACPVPPTPPGPPVYAQAGAINVEGINEGNGAGGGNWDSDGCYSVDCFSDACDTFFCGSDDCGSNDCESNECDTYDCASDECPTNDTCGAACESFYDCPTDDYWECNPDTDPPICYLP